MSNQRIAALMAHAAHGSRGVNSRVGAATVIRPRQRDLPAPLSFAQRRLWFLDELFPQSVAYNLSDAYRLRGPLQVSTLEWALGEIAERHETLRTSFAIREGDPVQVVHEPRPIVLRVTDLSGVEIPDRTTPAVRVASEHARIPFDLRRGPLWRAELLRLGPDDHIFLLVCHHAVVDLWSFAVLFEELEELYAARIAGRAPRLSPLPIQFADFAVWERQRFTAGMVDTHFEYWCRQLDGVHPIQLPFDHVRPPVQAFDGAHWHVTLGTDVVGRLRVVARDCGATSFSVLAAAMAALMARYSAQDDIALGAAVTSRNQLELEPLIGLLVNMLVLRADLSDDPPFAELVKRMWCLTARAHEHEQAPFEKLVEQLVPDRDVSRPPLINVGLTYFNMSGRRLALSGLVVEPFHFDAGIVQLDLDVRYTERDGEIRIDVAYPKCLFDEGTINRLFTGYERLLTSAVDAPARCVSELPIFDAVHRAELLAWGQMPAPGAPTTCTIHELFARRAAERPHDVAVACGARSLTFAALDATANRLARQLRDGGVGPDSIVGVCAPRSIEAVVGMLAALKAGAAYLPIDPEHPADRISFVLADARASALLILPELRALAPASVPTLLLDGQAPDEHVLSPPPLTDARDLAYVIYTSGSTGKPKGVMLEHAGVANLYWWLRHRAELRPSDIVTWIGSPAFDISILEIWPTLLAGARLEILPESLVTPGELQRVILELGVTVTILAVPIAEELLGLDWPPGAALRLMLTGADRLRRRPGAALPFILLNNYGPTETTVLATSGQVDPDGQRLPDIGRPLPNMRAYVVDVRGQLVPEGVTGELHVGGVGVARGYLGMPRLTAKHFVPDPFDPSGGRCYRTGDLVRWRRGRLEFVGRADEQVKIRGFRVELGEVEVALRAQSDVRDAVVCCIDQSHGNERLVSYVVPVSGARLNADALRDALSRTLPPYMVPAAIVEVAELPLTATGKIDRRLLPAPVAADPETPRAPPRNDLEARVAAVWARVLGVDDLGVRDHFFRIGGHSLLAMQATAELRRTLGVDLPVRAIFEYPTVEAYVLKMLPAGAAGSLPS